MALLILPRNGFVAHTLSTAGLKVDEQNIVILSEAKDLAVPQEPDPSLRSG